MIGILGASGKIGSLVLEDVKKLFKGEVIKVGAREPEKFKGDQGFLIYKLNLEDDEDVKKFFSDCSLVINCVGPSYSISPRLMNLAKECLVHFIDPGLIKKEDLPENTATSIIYGAGAVPGLSGLVENEILKDLEGVKSLDFRFFYEISDTFSKNAASDYLRGVLSSEESFIKEISKVYKDPNSFLNLIKGYKPVDIPRFPYRGRIFPFFDEEAQYINNKLKSFSDKSRAEFYTIISGKNFLDFLNSSLVKIKRRYMSMEEATCSLVEATGEDAKLHGRYLNMVAGARYITREGETLYKNIHIKTKGQAETSAALASIFAKYIVSKNIKLGSLPAFATGLSGLIYKLKDMDLVELFEESNENIFFNS